MKLDFMKYKRVYFLISGVFLLPSIFSLLVWGLKPAIDFTGGTILEIKTPAAVSEPAVRLRQIAEANNLTVSLIQKTEKEAYILKLEEIDKDQKQKLLSDFNKEFGEVEELRFEAVGPIIGRELIQKTIFAVVLAAGFILFYLAYRFKDKKYGICAVLAMFHDTLILLGAFSLLGHFFAVEIDTLFVTAVLTILSFSVHDTVVVYDRIRESIKGNPGVGFEDLVNKAVVETLTRSVNNSMTIIFMLLSLFLLGGETIKWFIFALLIGTIAGTYSSTFTAAPLLIIWENFKAKEKRKV